MLNEVWAGEQGRRVRGGGERRRMKSWAWRDRARSGSSEIWRMAVTVANAI